MNSLHTEFQRKLDQRRQKGNYRALKAASPALIDFASPDYLGLLHDQVLEQQVAEEIKNLNGCRTLGSRLLTGHSEYFDTIERESAQFHQEETGLIFNSGYIANLGLLGTLATSADTVICDQLVHASFHDALRFARAKVLLFRHLDTSHLEQRLNQATGRIFVCIESVYSCNGKQPDLKTMQRLCEEAGAYLIVDEAHATGWLGHRGEGAVQHEGLQGKIFARVHTFSKALGGQGAIVLGSASLREILINFSRPWIYTTALPCANLAWIGCAYKAMQDAYEQRKRLKRNIIRFRKTMERYSLCYEDSWSPIQCVKISGNHEVKKMAHCLQEEGFDVRPLMSPTVRRGEECLRICLHAFNREEEIDGLVHCLAVKR